MFRPLFNLLTIGLAIGFQHQVHAQSLHGSVQAQFPTPIDAKTNEIKPLFRVGDVTRLPFPRPIPSQP
ncbi:unnamed protein product [Rotaria magnacalcarata]|uniref:Uncharacterized protein n=1 Tax=Rotaria magnacalcarata TaxID=392030 RepID=A0A816PSG3_9BILA|nr:unnamed protein product [Rotaria magnacalcarata]CAF2052067.1 unnamed protein product [Rotaria magnacalcarata]CAF2266200.1 unnamed protein product [Rotaria magnacalcarata]CAF3828618.1 unnamed protein product [Rotaria magnacalcarata]CAF4365255.1 unnamed protein product [Rotaria magnacalcarata]